VESPNSLKFLGAFSSRNDSTRRVNSTAGARGNLFAKISTLNVRKKVGEILAKSKEIAYAQTIENAFRRVVLIPSRRS
jgi:hypothetical protein